MMSPRESLYTDRPEEKKVEITTKLMKILKYGISHRIILEYCKQSKTGFHNDIQHFSYLPTVTMYSGDNSFQKKYYL